MAFDASTTKLVGMSSRLFMCRWPPSGLFFGPSWTLVATNGSSQMVGLAIRSLESGQDQLVSLYPQALVLQNYCLIKRWGRLHCCEDVVHSVLGDSSVKTCIDNTPILSPSDLVSCHPQSATDGSCSALS